MMNELEKGIRTYLACLFGVEICIEYLYDVTKILFSHALKYTFFLFYFRKCANMLLFCGNIRLMV